jgi:hypothetical protein
MIVPKISKTIFWMNEHSMLEKIGLVSYCTESVGQKHSMFE